MVKSLSDINISTIKRDINLTSDEINCLDQDSKFLAINHLELTLLNLKKTLKQKFKCITCQEVFKSKNSLRKHKYIHTEKFQCKVCKAGFRDNYQLKRHENTKDCTILKRYRKEAKRGQDEPQVNSTQQHPPPNSTPHTCCL